MADKVIKLLTTEAVKGNTWMKFASPSAARGKTAFPKTQAEQERYGIRFDYAQWKSVCFVFVYVHR